MTALANVSLSDTFSTWLIRTNQLVVKTNDSELALISAFDKANSANYYTHLIDANTSSAFNKANSANLLAYNVGINTNNYLISVIAGANTDVGAGANAYAVSVGAGANNFLIATLNGANSAVGAGANAYAASVGAGANAFASATIAGANTAVGAGANNYLLKVIAGANTAVGAGANAFTSATIAGANTISIAAFDKANAALANTTVTLAGRLTLTSNVNVLSGNSTFSGSGYSIRGQTTTTSSGGIIGYAQNGTVYGILGYNNAWAFYGAGDGYVSSNFYASGNITAYYSDRRLKKDIVEIKNSLDIIRQISGVYYKQNDVAKSYGYNSEETQIGVIAQEIQKVIPQAVAPAPFDVDVVEGIEVSRSGENYLTVLPDKIIPVLIQAIKQLDERLTAIEDKLNQ